MQLVVGPTFARGETLDLLMTVVSDLVRVAVLVPKGNSDYYSLLTVILMAQAVSNMCVSNKVLLKHQVFRNLVSCAIQDLPWRNIWSADLVEFFVRA